MSSPSPTQTSLPPLPPFRILIIGSGIAGPALATCLLSSSSSRSSSTPPPHYHYHITILERSPHLRATGAQVDIRGPAGIEAVRRMGLEGQMRAKLVDEKGVAFVDRRGETIGRPFLAPAGGEGGLGLTAEWEIMRGDVVGVLCGALQQQQQQQQDEKKKKKEKEKEKEKGGRNWVEWRFGRSVVEIVREEEEEEEEGKEGGNEGGKRRRRRGVRVRFDDDDDDEGEVFDLVVGADGQGSRTRGMMMNMISEKGGGAEAAAFSPYWKLGVSMAYWNIPREDQDDEMRRSYVAPGGRMVFRRTINDKETQVLFFLRHGGGEKERLHHGLETVEAQKAFWRKKFADAGWEVGRFLEGLGAAKEFYCQEAVQVRLGARRWSGLGGRVVLLGDAAWCGSPFSGMGTTAALVGAYVLAGEMATSPHDMTRALERYEEKMRSFVEREVHQTAKMTWGIRLGMPETAWGVFVMQLVVRLVCFLRIPDIVRRLSGGEKEAAAAWCLPDYVALRDERVVKAK